MNRTEITIIAFAWLGAAILLYVVYQMILSKFQVIQTGEDETYGDDWADVLTNIGIEVAGVAGADSKNLVPITGNFKRCYLIGYACGDYLFRFYVYRKKIFYTIENFATGVIIDNTYKMKDGIIDYAALGDMVNEDYLSATITITGFEDAVDKADKASDNKELTNELLIESMLELARNSISKGDDVTGTAILTTLFRFAPDEVEKIVLAQKYLGATEEVVEEKEE